MPREFPEQGLTEVMARIPTADYEKFIGNFPMYGAISWFVREAFVAFNAKIEASPSLREEVIDSINEMMEQGRAAAQERSS